MVSYVLVLYIQQGQILPDNWVCLLLFIWKHKDEPTCCAVIRVWVASGAWAVDETWLSYLEKVLASLTRDGC